MTTRERLDEYLDGALDEAGRRDVEALVAKDAAAARLLSAMKSERALRNAAYASYKPTDYEASAMAHEVIAACEDEAAHPIGHISALVWTRRIAGVAAAIIIAAGAFAAGRASAPQTVVQSNTATGTNSEFVYGDARGTLHSFQNRVDLTNYIKGEIDRPNHNNPTRDWYNSNSKPHF